jgi:hypothetical protein
LQLGEYGTGTIPYGDAPPDRYKLGALYSQLQSADDQLQAAARRAERALESGDPAEQADAAADLAAALERKREVRLDLCDLVLGGLRVAAKDRPAELVEVLGTLLLANVQVDIDDCAAAVAALEREVRAKR